MVSVGPEKAWQAVPSQPGTPGHDRAAGGDEAPGASAASQGAAREFEERVTALIQQHASILLDEPLLPLAMVTPSGMAADSNRSVLVALDGRGRQVVVTVVHHLDLPALMSAIQAAGRLGFRSRSAMAKSYPGGGAAFDSALASFFRARPDLQATVGQLATQPRLVVVCGGATDDASEALRFLSGGGGGIEIFPLTAQVVGRVIAKVRGTAPQPSTPQAPVAQPAEPQAPVAQPAVSQPPAALQPAARSDAPPSAPQPIQPQPEPAAASADQPLAAPAHERAVDAPEADVTAVAGDSPDHERATASDPAPQTGSVPIPDFDELQDRPVPADIETSIHERAGASGTDTSAQDPHGHHATVSAPARRGQPFGRTEPLAITTEIPIIDAKRRLPRTVLPKPVEGTSRPPARALAVRTVALEAAVTGKSTEELTASVVNRNAERDLTVLCDELESAVPIVWVRQGTGERYEAVLHPEGMITLPTGIEYADPTRAARAISGSLSVADGWNLWRIGEYGPTLAEAWREVFGR
ncbi:hypothetical protein GCM10010401_05860 [Rarobacter faecitabidus]|uniref:RAMA domain-containing protein n=1 Tax=Rarobacter faecitabidus TaxID=13243 RepID=A0A542ZTH0_RARFA|nr:hypothetical protein [Rarobacter faecitabidus]TQL63662.1 hypothetical protein FB461_0130 [Rarobacter faecitabidus]